MNGDEVAAFVETLESGVDFEMAIVKCLGYVVG